MTRCLSAVRRSLALLSIAGVAAVAGLVMPGAGAASSHRDLQPAAAVQQVLAQLDTYFDSYQAALGRLIAEERLVQRVGRVTREMISDVAFVDLPDGAGWLGFRDVRLVSSKPVRTPGPSLAEVLSKGSAGSYAEARALLIAGASHNLGEARTTNLPNLPLEFLHQRNRWRYDTRIEGFDRLKGHRTAMVVLEEKSSPTLVQRPEGGDIVARVVGWIEPDTGRLWRAQVRLTDARLIFAQRHPPSEVNVYFAEDSALGLLVPERMEEQFFASERAEIPGTGEAHYRNFRRIPATTPQ